MIVDFYDYLELLSKAVYEIFSVFIDVLPFFLLLFFLLVSKKTHFMTIRRSRGYKVALVYLLVVAKKLIQFSV